jgi:hypothetical protein
VKWASSTILLGLEGSSATNLIKAKASDLRISFGDSMDSSNKRIAVHSGCVQVGARDIAGRELRVLVQVPDSEVVAGVDVLSNSWAGSFASSRVRSLSWSVMQVDEDESANGDEELHGLNLLGSQKRTWYRTWSPVAFLYWRNRIKTAVLITMAFIDH